jgi:hypothetical protein
MISGADAAEMPAIPWKLRLADAAALVLGAIALWIALVGGRRYLVLGVVISAKSPLASLYLTACVLIVRHLLWPRPTILEHLSAVRVAVVRQADFSAALRAFLATRPAVLIVGFLAVVTFGVPARVGFTLSKDPLTNLPARFDAGWYGGIAVEGYSWDHTFQKQRNIAFFPALPLLMRPVGQVLGMNDRTLPLDRRLVRGLWGGVLISLAAFLWALHYLVRLGRDLVGGEAAEHAALLLAAYPFALFFSAPYTESLFLLSAVGAFYHYRRGEWVASSAWGLVLGLTRPNGCFASVPLAILGLQQMSAPGWHRLIRGSTVSSGPARSVIGWRPAATRLLTAAMPGIGMLLFTAYLHNLTGVWFAWTRSHEAWGRTYQGLAPFTTGYSWLHNDSLVTVVTNVPYNTLNTIAVLFGLALTYPVFRRLGAAWGVFVLINLVPPLFAGGVLSMGRLTSTLFPLFLALAVLIPPRAAAGWAAGFGVAQGLCAALFFTWRELF